MRALVGLGRVRLADGDADGARTEFRHAHEAAPDDSAPLFWLGCAAAHQGELTSAEGYFTRSLACATPPPRAVVQRAYVRVKLGWLEQARDDLRAAARGGALDDEGAWVAAALGVDSAGGSDSSDGSDGSDGAVSGCGVRRVGGLLRKAGLGALGGGRADWARAARLLGAAWELDRVPGGFPALYGAALAVGGRRDLAADLLDTAARRDPADHCVTHALALTLLNSPRPTAPSGRTAPPWERAIAAWGALLYDDSFWERALRAAGRRYGVEVGADLVPELRAGLRDAVVRRLPGEGAAGESVVDGHGIGGHSIGGQDVHGGRVAPEALFQREADAAHVLAEAGGFPGEWGAPLRCGPLRISALGKVREFGSFAATTTPGGHPLIQIFSELGFAHLQLSAGLPGEALAALAELRCHDCRARARAADAGAAGSREAAAGSREAVVRSREAAVGEPVCEAGCPRFDELNPGYAGLPDRHRQLARDARELALNARVTLGRDELTAPRPDFGAAAAYWRRALVHSRRLERYRHTQADIVSLALAAARDAHRAGRLTRAVTTLETTRSVIGANERPRLDGQLARVLADRGIGEANREDPALDASAADLRRSVALGPRLRRAQLSLGIVLRVLALRRWGSGSLSGARATLEEAAERLTAALAHFPDDPELTEELDRARSELDFVRGQFDESGR
ncbi:hypothetical protein STRAU_4146 [Streptomyces aurantiacus JA 4570]|uniref:Uncharacterized protein n=1 Tax=Streptomyces aurantiacus JA 4570 TaxID=1286094 RepID=S3ZWK2_9ACTN|nr:hypothetical protein STRAU_4146 [Streptomyces aurantiacus JA 4570]